MAPSLSEIRGEFSSLATLNQTAVDAAAARDAMLTKPAGSLGKLETLAGWLSGWQDKHPPSCDHPQIIVFAGNHGVCEQGISAFPQEVTVQMVTNFKQGGAAINQLAIAFGASFSVEALELDSPTSDFTQAPAMSEAECAAALSAGWNSINRDTDILVVGEMGIGNTTVAAALSAALVGGRGVEWAGPGTGVSIEGVRRKAAVIDAGLERHRAILDDPLKILQCLGGREIAAIAGAILSARQKHIPVLLDGFVATAAAAVLYKANAKALDHCVAGHVSAEPGHKKLLKAIGKDPLLSLDMRLGEGSGAALALAIVKGAVVTHNGMASFTDAGVSEEKPD
jgi:nicotinate-nucleotide--dimethylbenzimidazole phosphoribosyltransferase